MLFFLVIIMFFLEKIYKHFFVFFCSTFMSIGLVMASETSVNKHTEDEEQKETLEEKNVRIKKKNIVQTDSKEGEETSDSETSEDEGGTDQMSEAESADNADTYIATDAAQSTGQTSENKTQPINTEEQRLAESPNVEEQVSPSEIPEESSVETASTQKELTSADPLQSNTPPQLTETAQPPDREPAAPAKEQTNTKQKRQEPKTQRFETSEAKPETASSAQRLQTTANLSNARPAQPSLTAPSTETQHVTQRAPTVEATSFSSTTKEAAPQPSTGSGPSVSSSIEASTLTQPLPANEAAQQSASVESFSQETHVDSFASFQRNLATLTQRQEVVVPFFPKDVFSANRPAREEPVLSFIQRLQRIEEPLRLLLPIDNALTSQQQPLEPETEKEEHARAVTTPLQPTSKPVVATTSSQLTSQSTQEGVASLSDKPPSITHTQQSVLKASGDNGWTVGNTDALVPTTYYATLGRALGPMNNGTHVKKSFSLQELSAEHSYYVAFTLGLFFIDKGYSNPRFVIQANAVTVVDDIIRFDYGGNNSGTMYGGVENTYDVAGAGVRDRGGYTSSAEDIAYLFKVFFHVENKEIKCLLPTGSPSGKTMNLVNDSLDFDCSLTGLRGSTQWALFGETLSFAPDLRCFKDLKKGLGNTRNLLLDTCQKKVLSVVQHENSHFMPHAQGHNSWKLVSATKTQQVPVSHAYSHDVGYYAGPLSNGQHVEKTFTLKDGQFHPYMRLSWSMLFLIAGTYDVYCSINGTSVYMKQVNVQAKQLASDIFFLSAYNNVLKFLEPSGDAVGGVVPFFDELTVNVSAQKAGGPQESAWGLRHVLLDSAQALQLFDAPVTFTTFLKPHHCEHKTAVRPLLENTFNFTDGHSVLFVESFEGLDDSDKWVYVKWSDQSFEWKLQADPVRQGRLTTEDLAVQDGADVHALMSTHAFETTILQKLLTNGDINTTESTRVRHNWEIVGNENAPIPFVFSSYFGLGQIAGSFTTEIVSTTVSIDNPKRYIRILLDITKTGYWYRGEIFQCLVNDIIFGSYNPDDWRTATPQYITKLAGKNLGFGAFNSGNRTLFRCALLFEVVDNTLQWDFDSTQTCPFDVISGARSLTVKLLLQNRANADAWGFDNVFIDTAAHQKLFDADICDVSAVQEGMPLVSSVHDLTQWMSAGSALTTTAFNKGNVTDYVALSPNTTASQTLTFAQDMSFYIHLHFKLVKLIVADNTLLNVAINDVWVLPATRHHDEPNYYQIHGEQSFTEGDYRVFDFNLYFVLDDMKLKMLSPEFHKNGIEVALENLHNLPVKFSTTSEEEVTDTQWGVGSVAARSTGSFFNFMDAPI